MSPDSRGRSGGGQPLAILRRAWARTEPQTKQNPRESAIFSQSPFFDVSTTLQPMETSSGTESCTGTNGFRSLP